MFEDLKKQINTWNQIVNAINNLLSILKPNEMSLENLLSLDLDRFH